MPPLPGDPKATMQATFENTNAGDQITLDGTLCEVSSKGLEFTVLIGQLECIVVHPANVLNMTIYAPEQFDAVGYQHLSGLKN